MGIVKNKKIKNFVLIVIVLTVLCIVFWNFFIDVFSNIDNFRDYVLGFGSLAFLAFILLVIMQVLFAPIPGQVAGLAGGFLFGAFFGTLYSLIGLAIGSYIAFLLGRKFGRPFVEKVVDKSLIKKFDKLVAEGGVFTLFLIYLLPALPDDAVCYLAGLTKIKIRTLVIISIIGRFPGFLVLSLIGSGLRLGNDWLVFWLFVVVLIFSFLAYYYREKLETMMKEAVRKIRRFL